MQQSDPSPQIVRPFASDTTSFGVVHCSVCVPCSAVGHNWSCAPQRKPTGCARVGDGDGAAVVGLAVGVRDGLSVESVGLADGLKVGSVDGPVDGAGVFGVGFAVGPRVGVSDGLRVASVGPTDGVNVGCADGVRVGPVDGKLDGGVDGDGVGFVEGAGVGALVGLTDGLRVGLTDG